MTRDDDDAQRVLSTARRFLSRPSIIGLDLSLQESRKGAKPFSGKVELKIVFHTFALSPHHHQQVFHNCEMSKGCCVFKILSSVFAKTVQESFENATRFVRNVHFLQFVLPPDFYNCAKKF